MRKGLSGGNLCLAPPHVRGEDNAKTGQARPERETPPRAWGRLFPFFPFGPYDRNTPTCVGKTLCSVEETTPRKKHPHVRGEDTSGGIGSSRRTETPPRAWGRPSQSRVPRAFLRNTPTCVGKTSRRFERIFAHQKHPHVRGEDPEHDQYGDVSGRNTPTCVGKTTRLLSRGLMSEKHPHVRGEDSCTRLRASVALETPPRAWGRLFVSGGCRKLLGNTPTCVGKTGECVSTPLFCVETPPRAWGRPGMDTELAIWRGNTPTCVGKTSTGERRKWISGKHPHVRGEDRLRPCWFRRRRETPPRAWGRRKTR